VKRNLNEGDKMKKSIFTVCIILLLSGCSKQKEPLTIEPTIENLTRYIVEEYTYGESGEFVERYLDNTYSTNLFLINLLKDSYDDISIISCDNDGALLNCDGINVRMNITLADGIISKIRLLEGRDE